MTRSTVPQPEKRKQKWTLLLVSETGKTIHLKWFKGLAVFCLLLFFAAVSAAGAFYYLYQIKSSENQWLRSALDDRNLDTRPAATPQPEPEKEPVSVAVLSETPKADPDPVDRVDPSNTGSGSVPSSAPVPSPGSVASPSEVASSSAVISNDTALNDSPKEEVEKPEDTAEDGATSDQSFLFPVAATEPVHSVKKIEKPALVAIEEFEYAHEKRHGLHVRYKIKNIDPDSRPVSGYAVVVLEGETKGKPRWLALPNVNLNSGTPTQFAEGQSFSISNYKFMTFRPKDRRDPDRFSKAVVYVFDEEGELMLKEDQSLSKETDPDSE